MLEPVNRLSFVLIGKAENFIAFNTVIHAIHIYECVMYFIMIDSPQQGVCAYQVQAMTKQVIPKRMFWNRPVICIMSDVKCNHEMRKHMEESNAKELQNWKVSEQNE